MSKYVALLRGIGPSNPNMHGSKLKAVLEELGFTNVQPVISSGNVIFESASKEPAKLEAKIQKAWPEKLGFSSSTIVRSQQQLQALLAAEPYKGTQHSRQTYQLITFFKLPPPKPIGKYYAIQGVNALCSVIDTTVSKTPDFMGSLERQYGKDITSRTYQTIERILKKMQL